jgi:hypothetical protein
MVRAADLSGNTLSYSFTFGPIGYPDLRNKGTRVFKLGHTALSASEAMKRRSIKTALSPTNGHPQVTSGHPDIANFGDHAFDFDVS